MPAPEDALREWLERLKRYDPGDFDLLAEYEYGCQIVRIARDEGKANRCPGCGGVGCLKVRKGN